MTASVTSIASAAARRAELQYRAIVQNLCNSLQATVAEIKRSVDVSPSERAIITERVQFKLSSMSMAAGTLRDLACEAAVSEALTGSDTPEHVSAPLDRVIADILCEDEAESR